MTEYQLSFDGGQTWTGAGGPAADLAGKINVGQDDYNRMLSSGRAKKRTDPFEQVRLGVVAETGDAEKYGEGAAGTARALLARLAPFAGRFDRDASARRQKHLANILEGKLGGYGGGTEAEKLAAAARKAGISPAFPGEGAEDFAERVRLEAEEGLREIAEARQKASGELAQTEGTVPEKIIRGAAESGGYALEFVTAGGLFGKLGQALGLGGRALRALVTFGSAVPVAAAEAASRYRENTTPEYAAEGGALRKTAEADPEGEAALKAIGGAALDTAVEVGLEAATMGLLRLVGKAGGMALGKATPRAWKDFGARKFNAFMASETGQALRSVNRAYRDFAGMTQINSPFGELMEENVQAFEKVLNLDGKTSEYGGFGKELGEFWDRQANPETQWDIFYGLVAQLAIGSAHSTAEGVARHISTADARRDVRMALARSGISEKTMDTLTPKQQKVLTDMWRRYSADPAALKARVKNLGVSMRAAVDELTAREGLETRRSLEERGIAPGKFTIQAGADGKPAFREMMRFAPDGSAAPMNAMVDAEHGVTVVDAGDGSFYVMNDARGFEARPAEDFAHAQEIADGEVRRNQAMDADNLQKAEYLQGLVERQYAGRKVEAVPTEAALRWRIAGGLKGGGSPYGITDASQLFDADGNLRQRGAGGFHAPDGTAVLILDNISSPADMERVLAHEATGHEGVERAAGRGAKTVDFIRGARAEGFERFKSGERARYVSALMERGIEEAAANAAADAAMSTDAYQKEAMARYVQGRLHRPTWMERKQHEANERRRAKGESVPFDQADMEVMLAGAEAQGRAPGGSFRQHGADSGVRYFENRQEANDETGTGADEAPAQPGQVAPAEPSGAEAARPAEGTAEGGEAAGAVNGEGAKPGAKPEGPAEPMSENRFWNVMHRRGGRRRVPLDTIKIPDTQFKEDADPKTGVVPGHEIREFYENAENPVALYERLDGSLELVTGRHRVDGAKRSGLKDIDARIFREADGYTPEDMKLYDAVANILDKKGTVKDYVRFFEESGFGEEDARATGILSTAKGRMAFGIYKDASGDTRSAIDWKGSGGEGLISAEQAGVIAEAAPRDAHPRNAAVQRILVRKALDGVRGRKLAILARTLAEEVKTRKEPPKAEGNTQLDLFTSEEDVALLELEERRAGYRAKKANDYRRVAEVLRTALRKGGKLDLNKGYAGELGITDAKDRGQIEAARDRAARLAGYWENAVRLDDADRAAMDAELGPEPKKPGRGLDGGAPGEIAAKGGRPAPKAETAAPKPAEPAKKPEPPAVPKKPAEGGKTGNAAKPAAWPEGWDDAGEEIKGYVTPQGDDIQPRREVAIAHRSGGSINAPQKIKGVVEAVDGDSVKVYYKDGWGHDQHDTFKKNEIVGVVPLSATTPTKAAEAPQGGKPAPGDGRNWDAPISDIGEAKKLLDDIGYQQLGFGGMSKVFTDRDGRKFVKYHANGAITPDIYFGETTPRDVAEQLLLYGNGDGLNLPDAVIDKFGNNRSNARNARAELDDAEIAEIKEWLKNENIPFSDVIDSERGYRIALTDHRSESGWPIDYVDVADLADAKERVDYIRDLSKEKRNTIVSSAPAPRREPSIRMKDAAAEKLAQKQEDDLAALFDTPELGSAQLEADSKRFDDELQRQIDGTLPDGHVYQMGRPGAILRSTGVPDLPIQLSAMRLKEKSLYNRHPFELGDVKGLVKALQTPVAVFSYGDKSRAQNIIVEITSNGKNFLVGLSLNPEVGGRVLDVNSIRNVFPKDTAEWLHWIEQGKLLYADKQKVQDLIDQQRMTFADVEYLDLNRVRSILDSFANPQAENSQIAGVDFDTPELAPGEASDANQRFLAWAKKWKLDPSKRKFQKEWAERNGVSFDTPGFDPDLFQKRVGAVAKLVKTYGESGVADFGTLATRMAERFPGKFAAMKPFLRGVWNAVAEQAGLPEVSRGEAEKVYATIGAQAKETGNERLGQSGQSDGNGDRPLDSVQPEQDTATAEGTEAGQDGAPGSESGTGVRVQGEAGLEGRRVGSRPGGRDSDAGGADNGTGDGSRREQAGNAAGESGRASGDRSGTGRESTRGESGGLHPDGGGRERDSQGGPEGSGPDVGVEPRVRVKKAAKKAADATKPNPKHRDFAMTAAVEEAILAKSAAARVKNNLDAIRLIRALKARDYAATPEEQAVLAKFVGWGGLREKVFGWDLERAYDLERSGDAESAERHLKRSGASRAMYELHRELRSVLNDAEYESAKESASTAFYTPVEFVRALHGALRALGVKGGRFLGPSAGTGNFASAAGEYEKPVNWHFVEKDAVTGEMLKALFPNQRVTVGGFEDTKFPDGFFDFAIDNVPYADVPVNDRSLSSRMFKIHDYFFAKTLSKLRPGGVMAFLTSTGTLDKTSPALRRFLTEHGGRIVGAVRLPNGFFSENAGTDVASDLVIVQKVDGRPDNSAFGRSEAYKYVTGAYNRKTRQYDKTPVGYNGYFKDNPGQVVGEMKVENGRFGPELKYGMPEGGVWDRVREAVGNALAGIDRDALLKNAAVAEKQDHAPIYDAEGLRQGNVALKDGKPYIKSGETLEPLAFPNDRGMKKELARRMRTPAKIMEGLIALRKAMRDVIDAQMSESDTVEADLAPLWAKLNEVYDAFVKKNGSLHDKWITPFVLLDRADGNRMLALERVVKSKNEKTGKDESRIVKSDIFSKRVISRGQRAAKADTPKDALVISYSETGTLSVPRIAELLGVNEETAVAKLKEGGDAFENPQTGRLEPSWEYLSGRVRAKLAAARAAVAAGEGSYRANVEALEKVQPPMVRLEDAEIKFGATWVDPECMKDFLRDAFGSENMDISLAKNEVTGDWNVRFGRVINEDPWGRTSWPPAEFISRVLNHGSMSHYETDPVDKKRYLNERQTEANKLAAEKLHSAFSQFIQSSDKWAAPMYERYNAVMTDMVEIRLPNNILPFRAAGMSEATLGKLFEGGDPDTPKKGREYQSAVIARGVLGSSSLCLAHCVGAGKTLEMQSIGVLGRRLGLFKKPMYVVPNHMLEQFVNEFMEAFPNANILKMSDDDVKPENRRAFFAQAANGDWDAIVVKHSTFSKKLAMSGEYQKEFIEAQKRDLEEAIAAMREAGERISVDQATKKLERLKAKLEQLANAENHDSQIVPFEELGVDQLFVDEAHNFKGMEITTRQGRTGGLSQGDSQRAMDMHMKTQYVQSLHGGDRGVVFATGTPLSNAPVVEAYVMLKYLAPGKLEEQGLTHFDDFVDAFGRITTESEFSLDGRTVKEKEKVSAFVNIPELMKLLRSVVDIVNPDQLDIPRPKPKYHMIDVEMSPAQEAIMEMVAQAASTPPSREDRNKYLTLTRIAKNACLTPRLLGFEDGGNKIIRAVAEIKRVYDETADNRGAQLVFTDIFNESLASGMYVDAAMTTGFGTTLDGKHEVFGVLPKRSGGTYNLNEEIRDLLVQAGVPKDEIAIIQDIDKSKGDKDANKSALFAKVRSGEVRVLIGSRPKMGEGTNVQERLAAIHLLHPGWKPSEDEQAIGRIIRYGNSYKEGQIFYYLTKGNAEIGSYETKNHQLIGVKSKLIDQVMHGDDSVREIDMDESAMDRDMLMGLASGNKALMELIDVKKRVHKLELNTESTMTSARRNKDRAEANSRILERKREEFARGQEGAREWREKNAGKPFALSTPDGRSLDKVKDMAEHVAGEMTRLLTKDRYDRDERTVLGDFNSVELVLAYDKWGGEKFTLAVPLLGVAREIGYSGFIPDFTTAAMTAFKGRLFEAASPDYARAVVAQFADMDRQAKKMSADADRLQKDYEQMRGELIRLRTRQAELEREVTPLVVQVVEDRSVAAYGNWAITRQKVDVGFGLGYSAVRERDGKELLAPTVKELIPLMDAEDFASPGNAATKTADLRPAPNAKGETPRVDRLAAGDVDFYTPGLYTGSAADYDKPSLHYVGTGEGSQVYGWGLYASDRRGVAEGYAEGHNGHKWLKNQRAPKNDVEREASYLLDSYDGDLQKSLEECRGNPYVSPGVEEELRNHGKEYEAVEVSPHLYEQTFFTDRATPEETERHLLKWYGPVGKEQLEWIESEARKEGLDVGRDIAGEAYIANPRHGGAASGEGGMRPRYWRTARDAYESMARFFGSPKAASEFLARAGIDGVKYPVDSYGKTVKDGGEAGWNYVSFRDDNIRVDHKWADGELLFDTPEMGTVRTAAEIDSQDGTQLSEVVRLASAIETNDERAKSELAGKHFRFARTSDTLKECGLAGDHFTIRAGVVLRHSGKDAAHNISPVEWVDIADALSRKIPLLVEKRDNREASFRIWVRATISGRPAVVGADVKNAGRDVFVNAIATAFGAENINPKESNIVYPKSEEEIRSVLTRLNSGRYPESPQRPRNIAQTGGEVKGVVTPAEDAAYMDAVRRGDMESAQRMVREAAKRKGGRFYRATRTPLKPEGGVPWMMFVEEGAANEYAVTAPLYGERGGYGDNLFIATDRDAVDLDTLVKDKKFIKAAKEFYGDDVDMEDFNPRDIVDSAGIFDDPDFIQKLYDDGVWGEKPVAIRTTDGLVIMGDSKSAPGYVKSLDPVTYDDAGNVIPLSQRFNPEREDIRFDTPELAADGKKQYDEVVRRYTNADGTRKPGWMRAPNGRPTNLTERQWVQVRTPAFKQWFGDWESAAELAPAGMGAAKTAFMELMARNAELNTADGATLRFVSQSSKAYSKEAERESADKAAHWCAVANIESIVGRSRYMFDEKPRNGSPDIDAYVKYGAVFTFGGRQYLAKITSKRYAGKDAQNFYSVESVSVEKIAARGIHEAIAKGRPLDASGMDRVAKLVASVKEVSEVVDGNGEPLVVWHSTDAEFTTFAKTQENDAGWLGEGYYFYGDRSLNGQYGHNVMPCFLNVRELYPISEEEHSRLVEADDKATSKAFSQDLRDEGYDGVYWNGDLNQEYAVFSPGQVKSATDNNGGFSGDPDINFDTPGLAQAEVYETSEKRQIEDDEKIGFTKADVEHARKVLGMDPLTHAVRTDETRHKMADALLSRSGYGEKLAHAVAKFGRPLFDYEQTAIGKYRAQMFIAANEAKRRVDALQSVYDENNAIPKEERDSETSAELLNALNDLKNAKAELRVAMARLDEADQANDKAGTEWGRAGRARQDAVKLPDFTYAGIVRDVARVMGGSEKIPQELMPKIEEVVKEFEKADDLQKKVVVAKFEKALDEALASAKKSVKVRKAVERMDGDEAKRAEKNYLEALAQFQVGAEETGGTLIGLADQKAPGWGKWLRYLAEYHCFMNPDIKVDECVAKMIDDLKNCGMNAVDEVQVWEAWTGYGHNFRQSRFESQRRANWLKEQALHLAQLHHMDETNTMPEVTGMIRDEDPTQEGRDLKKRVYDRKKEVPDAERDERHLKSILDTIKRSLDNRIAELKHALETGEKIPPRDRTVREDIEIRQKRKERDDLQEAYDKMFGTTHTLTPEQKIAIAEKAMGRILERDLEDIARAEKGDFSKKDGHPTINDRYVKTLERNLGKSHKTDSPTLQVLREKHLENVKKMLALKKAKYEYGMTPEEIDAHNAKKLANLNKRIARYAEMFATGDLRRNVSRQPPMTREQQKEFDEKEKQLKKAKRKLADLRYEAQIATMPKWFVSLKDYGAFGLAAQRALKTTIDFSSMVNQAAGMTLAHPIKAAKSFGRAWTAMWSDANLSAVNDEIMSDPQIQEAVKKYGLHLREVDAANDRDVDMFNGMESQKVKLFGKLVGITDIPLYGKFMLASERHYITYLNAISAEMYVHIANGINEKVPGGMTPWMKKQLCDMINIWNGSGAITNERRQALQKSGVSNFFFSLPLMVSQMQTVAWQDAFRPLYQQGLKNEDGSFGSVSDSERKTMAKIGALEHIKMSLATIALSALLRWIFANDDDRWQFEGANWFEKMLMAANPKIGNTTLDFTGGTLSTYRLLYKIASGFSTGKVKTGSGRNVAYGSFGGPNASSLVERFLEGKAAPWVSSVFSILNKKNYVGEDYGVLEAAQDMFVPMSLSDSYEQVSQNGLARSLFTVPLTLIGVRAQTYDRKPYENAVNRFLESKKEYDAIAADGLLDESTREMLLAGIRDSNPLMRDDTRVDIAADIAQIRKDEARIAKDAKEGNEPDAGLLSVIAGKKAKLIEKIRRLRR